MVKLLSCFFLLSLSQVFEYRFLTNFGEVFYDYSGSGNHGVNGDRSDTLNDNAYCTDRGVFLKGSQAYVRPPINDLSSSITLPTSFSIDCWTKVEDTDDGILYLRENSGSPIMTIKRSKINEVLEVILGSSSPISGSVSSFPSSNLYLETWVLISVTYSSNKIYLLKNQNQVGISTVTYSDSTPTATFIGHKSSSTIKGFISSFSIFNTIPPKNFINFQQSLNCLTLVDSCQLPCDPAVIINNVAGCISLEDDPYKDSRSFTCDSGQFCTAGFLLSCQSCASKSCSISYDTLIVKCINDLSNGIALEIAKDCLITHRALSNKCCYKECTICEGIHSEKCLGCVETGAVLSTSGRCSCPAGYGGNHPLVLGSCVQCKPACATCTNSTICLTCNGNNAIATQNGCACAPGYYGSTSLYSNVICNSCKPDCKTCGDANSCNSCIAEQANSDSSSATGCVCRYGYSGIPPLNKINSCTSSIQCLANCEACSTANSCDTCAVGYFKSLQNGIYLCLSCFSHCSKCSDSTSCSECKATYANTNGNQGCICMSGYFANNTNLNTQDACVACHTSCTTCTNPDPCTPSSCNIANSEQDPTGQCKCKTGYYLDSTIPSTPSCSLCHAHCQTCDNINTCLACKGNSKPSPSKGCECSTGTYIIDSSSPFITCTDCVNPCQECTSKTFCTKCLAWNLQPDTEGQCLCPQGYFFIKNPENSFECSPCDSSCKTCEELETCLTCANSSEILNESTGKCVEKCGKGFRIDLDGFCVCDDGKFKNFDENGLEQCLSCEEPCKECKNKTFCISCVGEFRVKDGICVDDCEKGSFFNGIICENCEELCLECISLDSCISCVEGADMVDGLCECNKTSTRRNGKCFLNYFYFDLLKNSNRVFMAFNESINSTLDKSLVNVSVSESKRFSFDISLVSKKKVVLTIYPLETIPKNTTLTVKVLKNPFFSEKGSLLLKYQKSIQLDEIAYEEATAQLSQVAKVAKPLAQTSVSTGLGVSMISNPASAWLLINTLQLILYLPISKNSLTPGIRKFCTSFGDINFLPNPIQYIFSKSSTEKPSKNQQNTGIETSVFLINGGQNLGVILMLLVLYPFILIISKMPLGRITLAMFKMLKNYKYGMFLRYWIQAYLDLGIFALVQIRSEIREPFAGYFNLGAATVCMLLVVLTPFFLFVSSYISYERLQDHDADYTSMYGSLFYEFKNDKGFFSSQYYTLFFIRRLAYILAHFYLDSQPMLKIGLHIGFTSMMIIFLLIYRPYKENSIYLSSLSGEFAAMIAFILSFMLCFKKFENNKNIEACFIYSVVLTIIFQTLVGIYEFCKSLLDIYRKFEKQRALAFKKAFEASRDNSFFRF